jgi:hypothetical protein
METKHLSSFIDSMQKALYRNNTKTNPIIKLNPNDAIPSNLKSEFCQSIEKKVMLVRSKIN